MALKCVWLDDVSDEISEDVLKENELAMREEFSRRFGFDEDFALEDFSQLDDGRFSSEPLERTFRVWSSVYCKSNRDTVHTTRYLPISVTDVTKAVPELNNKEAFSVIWAIVSGSKKSSGINDVIRHHAKMLFNK